MVGDGEFGYFRYFIGRFVGIWFGLCFVVLFLLFLCGACVVLYLVGMYFGNYCFFRGEGDLVYDVVGSDEYFIYNFVVRLLFLDYFIACITVV